jgi:HAD superfamily hydrolase (TIGR01509 family)
MLGRPAAIIFDFNGVIADDETPHFVAFQQALQEEGLVLSAEEYYGSYLGMDERTCVSALLRERTGANDPLREQRIHDRKASLFKAYTATHKPPLFPGVASFVAHAAERCRLAIATGGRREQVLFALEGTPIENHFELLVSAEDVQAGKPDPAIYQLALARLNALAPGARILEPKDCLVIEDSLAGIHSAIKAGMKVLAVATTYPAHQLREADRVIHDLNGIRFDSLTELFDEPDNQRVERARKAGSP